MILVRLLNLVNEVIDHFLYRVMKLQKYVYK